MLLAFCFFLLIKTPEKVDDEEVENNNKPTDLL